MTKYNFAIRFIALLLFCISMGSYLHAQEKRDFVYETEEQATVDSLTTVYLQQGLDEKEAYFKAYKEVNGEEVMLRYSGSRPTNPHDSSIRVDRDLFYRDYSPTDLVRKVLLKAPNPSYEARIQNVRFVGVGGKGTIINPTEWEYDGSIPDELKDAKNRSLTYFEGDPQGRFPFNRGLLLSTGESHCVEGPNKQDRALGGGVIFDGRWFKAGDHVDQNNVNFDADITHTAREGQSTANTTRGALLEFDFSPASDMVSFDYIFGSEEYPGFVWSNYNDVFGFYISGPFDEAPSGSPKVVFPAPVVMTATPDPGFHKPQKLVDRGPVTKKPYTTMKLGSGATEEINTVHKGEIDGVKVKKYIRYNIAQLPNGDPVGVNSVNWGARASNLPTLEAWNLTKETYLYPFILPFDAELDDNGFLKKMDDLFENSFPSPPAQVSFADQKINKEINSDPHILHRSRGVNMAYFRPIIEGEPLMEMNGITTKLTAKADSLVPDKWYHLKMVVAQVDHHHGDVVFLSNLDLGESGSHLAPLGEKEGAGWEADWDTIHGGAGYPSEPVARFAMYETGDREFTITTEASAPSYVKFERHDLAQDYLKLYFEDGRPVIDDTVHIKADKDSFKIIVRPLKKPAHLEGKKGCLTSFVALTPGIQDTVVHYKCYNRPTTKLRFIHPTENYSGMLDLGINGGTPKLYRSFDYGDTWRCATEPITRREISLMEDNRIVWLREPNSPLADIIVRYIPPTVSTHLVRMVELPVIPHATTDKPAGRLYPIPSGSHIDFVVTPDAGYEGMGLLFGLLLPDGKESRAEINVEKRADGSYVVMLSNVREDVRLQVESVVSNEAAIESGRVWTRGTELLVYSSESQQVAIYTLSGALTKRFPLVAGETRSLRLPNGVYLVRLGESNETYKVVIR